ncbi:MAG TPA: helix-turn-helix domain-containing protein [Candidatus Binatia bacterium]|nr:helix-turn-helix domain-containing protein [Candidatus Binatia bacterium]
MRRSSGVPGRATATAARRRAILDAALDGFTAHGFQATTMEDIRRRAGASTGSLYHHFESKEQLAGELYLEGTRRVQESGLAALLRHDDAERGIRAVVRWYLAWVARNPKLASYLIEHRHAEFMASAESALDRMNHALRDDVMRWIDRHVAAGELPALGMEMYWAILIGPSELVCRHRVRDGRAREIARFARDLEDAAWGALRAIARRRRSGRRP